MKTWRPYLIEFKWAAIYILLCIGWASLQQYMGMHTHLIQLQPFAYLIGLPFFSMYLLTMLDERKNVYDGFLTYKEGYMAGLRLTIFILLLTPLQHYIQHTHVTPEFLHRMETHSVQTGKMTASEAARHYSQGYYLIISMGVRALAGVGLTFLLALVCKSKPRPEIPTFFNSHFLRS